MPFLTAPTWLPALTAVAVCAILAAIVYTVSSARAHARRHGSGKFLLTVLQLMAVVLLFATVICWVRFRNDSTQLQKPVDPAASIEPLPSDNQDTQPIETDPAPTDTSEPTEPTDPEYHLTDVAAVEESDPSNWKVQWEVIADGKITANYSREETISFGNPLISSYYALPGVSTFRGDNYRSGAVYGTVDVQEEKLTDLWSQDIGSLAKGTGSGVWTGTGWTGQPVIVQWDQQTRQNMNLYESKKNKEDLVEVIYATMDGNIYFYDLEDGSYTRDPINIGMTVKGSSSLDPRGYPILYVGAGDKTSSGKIQRMFIINLIDGTVAFEYGNDDSWRNRNWTAFDSSPLIDGDTDTLIWPGESGILYTMKLNTSYDAEAGTLSIAPDEIVRTRYATNIFHTIGYEASAVAVDSYLYIADNGGMLFCVDLNTLELIWAQYLRDDINASPVFEWDQDGNGYLYVGSSMEYSDGTSYTYKINAATGEIVWETAFTGIVYDYAVSGGILSSPVLGKSGTELEGIIFWSVAKTPGTWSGLLVAQDTETGEILWQETLTYYCWSSPIAVYNDDGEGWLILCDSNGYVMLIDPANGQILDKISLGSNIESSPAMFNDILVVGTRGCQVHGIQLS